MLINIVDDKYKTEFKNIITKLDDEIKFEEAKNKNLYYDKIEPLTDKGIEKIGIFIRSGLIDFIKEKNENINDSSLAKFIQELTSEPLKWDSIRPHLTTNTNSDKHPFYAIGRLNELDSILSKYGIQPQANE